MTNTKLLKQKIKESGYKIGFIAEQLQMARNTLWLKINDVRPFNQYEINELCNLLNITSLNDKEAIFFAKNVI